MVCFLLSFILLIYLKIHVFIIAFTLPSRSMSPRPPSIAFHCNDLHIQFYGGDHLNLRHCEENHCEHIYSQHWQQCPPIPSFSEPPAVSMPIPMAVILESTAPSAWSMAQQEHCAREYWE